MIHQRCPSCGSPRPCEPYRLRHLSHYTCRNAWHMPTPADDALAFVAEADRLFEGDHAPAVLVPDGMSRRSTAEVPW